MKSILIATIGTRDLMFRIQSGEWFNIGDDRMQNADIIGEQAEVISDLGHGAITFRDLTKYLLDNLESYTERIAPTIIGKLLTEKANEIEKVYLIATDQKLEVREREKDTLYAAELLKNWILHKFDCMNHDSVEVITLGSDGTNPANFEEMFQWWRKTWKKITIEPSQMIWVCLKGGVGQTSEASRISGLSLFGDRILFFEFKQNTKANRIGTPSDYSGPFLGSNYLWDRTRQQALKLLQRYDYAEVYDLLQPYFISENSNFGAVPNLLKAGIAWNQGQFERFLSLARSSMTIPGQIDKTFWWMAYEQAYLGTIRLEQQNTTEALLHSHRAVEGALYAWAIASFPNYVTTRQNQFPDLHNSILSIYPSLKTFFDKPGIITIPLKGWALEYLLNATLVETKNSSDFREFWKSAREIRNNLSHRLGGISEKEVFQAWGTDIITSEQWQKRVLNCLNLISGKSFKNLAQASIFAQLHNLVMSKFKDYE